MGNKLVGSTQRIYQQFSTAVDHLANVGMEMTYTPVYATMEISSSEVLSTFEIYPPSLSQEFYRVFVITYPEGRENEEGAEVRHHIGDFVDFPKVMGACMGHACESFARMVAVYKDR